MFRRLVKGSKTQEINEIQKKHLVNIYFYYFFIYQILVTWLSVSESVCRLVGCYDECLNAKFKMFNLTLLTLCFLNKKKSVLYVDCSLSLKQENSNRVT